MTSKITSNIDGTFPVAGQDNSTQGFRTNFTNTNDNFTYAAQEITDLQNKVILKSALTDQELDNNMFGTEILNPTLRGVRETIYDFGTVSGAVGLNFLNASYFTMTLGGSVVIGLNNFSTTAGSNVKIRVQFNVPNAGYTVTWPASVNTNITSIAGVSGQTITFSSAGTYVFELLTNDGGTNFIINDLSRARSAVQGGYFAVLANIGNVSTAGITMTVAADGTANVVATNFIGNIITTGGNSAVFVGNVTANNFIASNAIVGTLATPLQPNVTLLGTLSSVSVTGNANVGNITVSGLTDMCGGDAYGIQFEEATNTGTTQILSNVGICIVNPVSSTIAAHTVVMPQTPYNGQAIRIGFANTITTLTHSGSGTDTIYAGLTTATTASGGTWVYVKNAATNSGNGAWYKIG